MTGYKQKVTDVGDRTEQKYGRVLLLTCHELNVGVVLNQVSKYLWHRPDGTAKVSDAGSKF